MLDIEDDLSNLRDSDNEEVEVIVEDLSIPAEITKPDDIFMGRPTNQNYKKTPAIKSVKERKLVTKTEIEIPDDYKEENVAVEETVAEKPQKKKRVLSERQKEHLAKARIKAREAHLEKTRLKKEIKQKVKVEVEAKRKQQKEEPVKKEELSEDFKERLKVPSEEEVAAAKKQKEEMSFLNFMSNMEKYKVMKYEHRSKKEKEEPKPKKVIPPRPQVQRQQTTNVQSQSLPDIVKPKPQNPYEGLFQW